MSIQNLSSKKDPFAEDFDDEDTQQLSKAANDFSQKREASDVVHIRVQQRNGRKTLTTIQGLPEAFDPKKAAKKEFACNGSMVEDEIYGQVIQLQGDQRQKISALLLEEGLDKTKLKVHGF